MQVQQLGNRRRVEQERRRREYERRLARERFRQEAYKRAAVGAISSAASGIAPIQDAMVPFLNRFSDDFAEYVEELGIRAG